MTRRATESDIAELTALESELFGTTAWSRAQVSDEVARGRVRIARDGRGVTAYIALMTAGDVTDLLRIGVRPDRQRRGVAGALLAGAIERATGKRMMLEVSGSNQTAVSLYRRHGFETVDRRRGYYRDGSDALVMCRDLPTDGGRTQ